MWLLFEIGVIVGSFYTRRKPDDDPSEDDSNEDSQANTQAKDKASSDNQSQEN